MIQSIFGIALIFIYSCCFAEGWHKLEKVTQVTLKANPVAIYVKGTNPTGIDCSDEKNLYGTLNHFATEPDHEEIKELAFQAYFMEKGLSCYVIKIRENGVCQMNHCYIE